MSSVLLQIFGLSAILFCYSCQDTQPRRETKTKESETKLTSDTITVTDTIPDGGGKDEFSSSTENEYPLLDDKNVREFLLKYGKEHPETRVQITIPQGEILIELDKRTPIHRASFLYLANRGFFDETFFYRVAEGFVIQGGNSDRPQMSKKKAHIGVYTLPQEQVRGLSHRRGALALSKQWVDNPSNRSTPFDFFIVVNTKRAQHLDGEHTIFGKVIKGMNVVDEISKVAVDQSEWPLVNIPMKVKVLP